MAVAVAVEGEGGGYFSKIARKFCRKLCCRQLTGMVKKVIQQGHSRFGARSVLPVREHGKRATCLREAASAGMEPLACQP